MNAAEFEQRYRASGDPWEYRSSAYEREKYDATLRACGSGPFAAALELGGSIGVFSARLAVRCRALITVDFAPSAVDIARRELAPYPHAEALLGEIPAAIPDGRYDLVVASETLYYLDAEALSGTLARLAQVLAPDGRLVLVHWRAPGPERPHTAETVHAMVRALPWLVTVEDASTPDYLMHTLERAVTDSYGLLVLGGGPAGLAAARSYRERRDDGRVAIVTDEYRPPYQRPPLTKGLLRGESSADELPLEDDEWYTRQRVELIGGRAVSLDGRRRVVDLSGGRQLGYEQCVIATGSEPTRLPIPGADHPRVHVLRTLANLRDLTGRLEHGANVAVIGSGFIGCEIAASLRMRGHPVELVSDEPAPNVSRLGAEAGSILAGWLAEVGVVLHLGAAVERIGHAASTTTVCAGAHEYGAEVIVMASGVSPRSELASMAGLELDGGAIPVDAGMRTDHAGLLAAGDVAQAENLTAGRALRVEHWGDALTQGEIAGATAAGAAARWTSVPGFWSTIGTRTLKYAAWGDGFDEVSLDRHASGAFTARYGRDGVLVGVLTHQADDDYERGSEQIKAGAQWPS